MKPTRIVSLADDLTGAAEIAAIGFRHGLRSAVSMGSYHPASGIELLVHDTDSRLWASKDAAKVHGEIGRILSSEATDLVYKKTDSALRGNILSECIALARALRRPRVLLVPTNPSLGRTIRDGHYFIDGQPIHETAFANDPHHPAKSPRVIDLLRTPESSPVSVIKPGTRLPGGGVVVGETSALSDVAHWASLVDGSLMAAGGADFFAEILKSRGFSRIQAQPCPLKQGPSLVVLGSTTPVSGALIERAASASWPVQPMPETVVLNGPGAANDLDSWIERVAFSLEKQGVVLATPALHRIPGHEAAAAIRSAFAILVKRLHAKKAFAHLSAEGGATAAAIAQANGWGHLELVHEWAQGVISLRPTTAPDISFAMKPGSYSWPEEFWQFFNSQLSGKNSSHSR